MGFVLRAHFICDESHIQHNANAKGLQHLQQGWARPFEMTESERKE